MNICFRIGLLIFLLGNVCFFSSCSDSNEEPAVLNEDVFINEVYSNGAGEDWLELYNASSSPKDISGYFIYDDVTDRYTIPNPTIIPANGFLVLICDGIATSLHTNFKLSSEGETVYLENKSNTLIDKVAFPALGKGQSYGRFPDGSTTFSISGSPTEGQSNGDNEAPAFLDVTQDPLVPSPVTNVNIQAQLVSTSGITSVTLFYRLGTGSYTSVAMSLTGSFYNGVIPAAGITGKMEYYVEAKNSAGKTGRKPVDAPDDTYSYLLNTDPLPTLFINEFMAVNSSCCPDKDSGVDEFDDWIEIYNGGAVAVNIAGMYLSDSKNNPFMSKISKDNPSATTIQPGGFLILWADDSKPQGPLHLNFKLDAAGEDIGLFYIDGRTIDTYTFTAQSENVSWGRSTNGGLTWKSFTSPTQGVTNQ